jgi:hypothetical protein
MKICLGTAGSMSKPNTPVIPFTGNSTVEHEAVARMRTTIKAQEAGASDFQNSHDTNLGSLQSHTDHCFNEEYMV